MFLFYEILRHIYSTGRWSEQRTKNEIRLNLGGAIPFIAELQLFN